MRERAWGEGYKELNVVYIERHRGGLYEMA